MIDRNHPAVRIINTHSAAWHGGKALLEFQNPGVPFVGVSVPHAVAAGDVITAALPHLTADDLRDTPAGRALMAEALEDEACRMDVVISNGDAAEQAAPAPGETGRGGAVTARDALYENPAQYLRKRADAYRTETPDE